MNRHESSHDKEGEVVDSSYSLQNIFTAIDNISEPAQIQKYLEDYVQFLSTKDYEISKQGLPESEVRAIALSNLKLACSRDGGPKAEVWEKTLGLRDAEY